ncbi:hypothetical protein GCM10011402_07230 [Paracoccus acridae]|uniref:Uncharacterized protein n=1 Tax=Paracoccus acridae TaxID=1795310 RepID=A0ABQ1VFY3_9RHOB|nr:hypothetical protein GCM10011402_07230 [Paracoccus acridae]
MSDLREHPDEQDHGQDGIPSRLFQPWFDKRTDQVPASAMPVTRATQDSPPASGKGRPEDDGRPFDGFAGQMALPRQQGRVAPGCRGVHAQVAFMDHMG